MAKKKKLVGAERKQRMIGLRRDGLSLAAIAIMFGISKTRVAQILGDVPMKRIFVEEK